MMFETSQNSRLFIILLGDFLSELRAFKSKPIPLGLKPPPSHARPSDLTFLYYLRQVCAKPQLGTKDSDLQRCTESFATCLEGEFVAPRVNLSAINVVTDLRVSRYRYLKICGDIAKHNLARLGTNVAHIRRLLEASGHAVSEQDAYLAVENFFEWFHGHIFSYHSSQIAEFLNNIRWAIFNYLQPEYARSWHRPAGADLRFFEVRLLLPRRLQRSIGACHVLGAYEPGAGEALGASLRRARVVQAALLRNLRRYGMAQRSTFCLFITAFDLRNLISSVSSRTPLSERTGSLELP